MQNSDDIQLNQPSDEDDEQECAERECAQQEYAERECETERLDITDVVVEPSEAEGERSDFEERSEETPTRSGEAVESKRGRLSKFWDILLWVLVIVLAVAVALRIFVFSKITVSGQSMTNAYYNAESSEHYDPALTFHDGDNVTVLKTAKPKRGEVVVFYKHRVDSKFKALFAHGADVQSGGKYEKLIKRVVALGGDKIWLEKQADGSYLLAVETPEGDILHEDYYTKKGKTLDLAAFALSADDQTGLGRLADTSRENCIVISQGCFFAMGDNRANSADSRGVLGEVSLDQLFGVVR